MSDDKNTLPLLLVTEAIRELEKRFEGMNDKTNHIETHICNLGKKPGFVMTSQILRNGSDIEGLEEICKFIATRFSQSVFSVQAKPSLSQSKIFTLTFVERSPSWFQCLIPPNSSATPQQMFWFRAYGHFVMGVFCGALLHFGYKATPSFEKNSPLTLSFKLEELEGTWEFASNVQH
ncbi:hypothetical protein TRFO_10773 [Tritrichomonas foetus]|uniref:Uncharacterized protein n=1 Tax=Tritrichomonas foetus TaxID=1144522 RepID=A0A1J4JB27_9EUKA|nr:hypothetical protein TRFO_10773 [Tritrichomonas foetus]|eukprot:OHS94859.1 hypothetical protein TRFO_10773 [Tritrichomonas foetus]